MTQDKARELFSSYYEGTLESGLSQALAQNLQRDRDLLAEYRSFERTYETLGTLKYDSIEVPFDLHDRILARIDRHTFETERSRQGGWFVWVRNIAIGAVASVAVVGAILSLRGGDAPVTGAGGLVSISRETVTIAMEGSTPVAILNTAGSKEVIIRDASTGEERKRILLDGERVRSPLTNGREGAATFLIEVAGEPVKTYVSVPGSAPTRMPEGEGILPQFLQAVAQHYRVPVAAKVRRISGTLNWNFEASEPVAAIASTLDTHRYSVERQTTDLVLITEQ